MKERWRIIDGYNEMYEISDRGRVRTWKNNRHGRLKNPRPLKLWENACGRYVTATLSKNNNKTSYLVHRLVAEAFIGHIPNGCVVCHKDDVGTNNLLENLYIGTFKDNSDDMRRNGGAMNNGRHFKAVLEIEDVKFIRKMRGKISQRKLGNMFNICQGTVSEIQLRKIWKHVKDNT